MSEALLIVAHGSHLNPKSSAPAQDHADAIRVSGAVDEVREAYWKEEPSLRNALRTVSADEVYVVPLFVSEGYFTEEVLPRELRLDFDAALPGLPSVILDDLTRGQYPVIWHMERPLEGIRDDTVLG